MKQKFTVTAFNPWDSSTDVCNGHLFFGIKPLRVAIKLATRIRKHLSKNTCLLGNYDSNFTSHVNARNICSVWYLAADGALSLTISRKGRIKHIYELHRQSGYIVDILTTQAFGWCSVSIFNKIWRSLFVWKTHDRLQLKEFFTANVILTGVFRIFPIGNV